MPPQPPPKGPKRPAPTAPPTPPKAATRPAPARPVPNRSAAIPLPAVPPVTPVSSPSGDVGLGVAVEAGGGGTVTARKAGALRDMGLEVDPDTIGIKGALQHLAKAVNIAF